MRYSEELSLSQETPLFARSLIHSLNRWEKLIICHAAISMISNKCHRGSNCVCPRNYLLRARDWIHRNPLQLLFTFLSSLCRLKCAWALMLRMELIKKEVFDFQGEWKLKLWKFIAWRMQVESRRIEQNAWAISITFYQKKAYMSFAAFWDFSVSHNLRQVC